MIGCFLKKYIWSIRLKINKFACESWGLIESDIALLQSLTLWHGTVTIIKTYPRPPRVVVSKIVKNKVLRDKKK